MGVAGSALFLWTLTKPIYVIDHLFCLFLYQVNFEFFLLFFNKWSKNILLLEIQVWTDQNDTQQPVHCTSLICVCFLNALYHSLLTLLTAVRLSRFSIFHFLFSMSCIHLSQNENQIQPKIIIYVTVSHLSLFSLVPLYCFDTVSDQIQQELARCII